MRHLTPSGGPFGSGSVWLGFQKGDLRSSTGKLIFAPFKITDTRTIMKILFVLLFCFISTVANAEPLRIYLIYGDWPVAKLAKQIKSLNSQYIVTTHHWKRHEDVIDSIRKLPVDKKVVIVGYSTGAMTTTLISNAIPDRQIELAIAYDSSTTSTVYLVAPNVKRFFYNNDGRAYAGSRVLVSDFREKLLSRK